METDEVSFEELTVTSKNGRCRVTLEWIGEGASGDYDPDDPGDQPLLRFNVARLYKTGESPAAYYTDYDKDYVFTEPEWVGVSDASYCTNLDARAPRRALRKIAMSILSQVESEVRDQTRIKRRCEELSWLEISKDGK